MAYTPPPKFYPPVVLDEGTAKYELTQPWHLWFLNLGRAIGVLQDASAAGYTGTVALAKITGGGADGSLTIVNGLITAVTAPT